MERIWKCINLPRIIIGMAIINISADKDVIWEDLLYWSKLYKYKGNTFNKFSHFLYRTKEFRNVVVCYMSKKNKALSVIFRILFPIEKTLFINTDVVGRKLFIQHGFSTIISAKSIGDGCWINQQVTVGYEGDKQPVIGNYVRLCAGAIVVGDVKIKDNSIIAAGAVVTHDVPENQVWGGVPASFIKHVKDKSYNR